MRKCVRNYYFAYTISKTAKLTPRGNLALSYLSLLSQLSLFPNGWSPNPNTSLNRSKTASAVCTYERSYRREASPFRIFTAGPPRFDKRLYITQIDKHASSVIARSAQIDSDNAAVGRTTPRWVHRREYYASLD